MCGIIGVTGTPEALDLIIEGLSRLEYRGYDSAGVVLATEDGLARVRRAEGTESVASLRAAVAELPKGATTGIGHTRWATHGGPTEDNAHPHVDCAERVAVVHNGIIENHASLAERLRAEGHRLTSDTDTELVAHLVESHLATAGSLEAALRAAMAELDGAFSLGVMDVEEPGTIVAARRVSPLIVGEGKGAAYLASDIPALLGVTDRFMAIDDDQLVVLRPGSVVVSDLAGNVVTPEVLDVHWDLEAAQKDGHDTYMAKEIREQPQAVADTLRGQLNADGEVDLGAAGDAKVLSAIDRVLIVACGSSYHAAMVAKYAIEAWARVPCEVDIASEFRYRQPIVGPSTLVVAVSQSGETLDTLQAMREAARHGAPTLAVTNVVGSTMAREADLELYTRAGLEVGVAATKTVVAQIVALELLALRLAQLRGGLDAGQLAEVAQGLTALPAAMSTLVEDDSAAHRVASDLAGARDFFFLGRHVGFPVALEGALKLKEISYLHAEGYPAGELKHGPIAMIEPGTVVVVVSTGSLLADKVASNVAEVKSRGATVVAVTDEPKGAVAATADYVLPVPAADALLSPLLAVVPLQQLAYWFALGRGFNVDRPRNLAKTVTVE